MYTRTVECTVKPDKRHEFTQAVRNQIQPVVSHQPGFIDLLCLISSERPDHGLVITVWKSQSEAAAFYQGHAPMVEFLKPFVNHYSVEHFHVDTSTVYQKGSGKAA
jgi:quinol monooxygenase YgiN